MFDGDRCRFTAADDVLMTIHAPGFHLRLNIVQAMLKCTLAPCGGVQDCYSMLMVQVVSRYM